MKKAFIICTALLLTACSVSEKSGYNITAYRVNCISKTYTEKDGCVAYKCYGYERKTCGNYTITRLSHKN